MTKIGFINEGECESNVNNPKVYYVNEDNPNFPGNENSPNYPRGGNRVKGYQNPLLGDPGFGEIARWYKVKASAVSNLVDQMIAHFSRDRNWYSTVRCKEALWNMYRRLEWWVEQNVGLDDSEYKRALTFIQDCIYKILDTGEEQEYIKELKFVGELLDDFIYSGEWFLDPYGYLKTEGNGAYISTIVTYPNKGLLTFNFATEEYTEDFTLFMDGTPIWTVESTTLRDDSYSFRDVTLPIPAGEHTFKWEVGYGTVRFDEFEFIELKPTREVDEDIPKCPPSYINKYSSDYANDFTGIPYERALFSTVGANGVSSPLDLLRYVSSKENIEWIKVKSLDGENGNENILKLPLERLPETLSSKLTFNVRMKRKGFITFKYLMESGDGSKVSLYINNRKATYDLGDTSEWEEVRVNLSQSQTYKFDILVHKLFSSDIGVNAVYIKDVEVVEVTDYTDEPMPGDYTMNGEKLTGKWLIYSHRNALGSYYRGFPDGEEDMVREFEFKLYSECDGVFSFGHILGTENPDRFFVDGTVFLEQFKFDDSEVVWDGSKNGVGVPIIKVNPTYNHWNNQILDEQGLGDYIYWTKDSTNLNYQIDVDGLWDKGHKSLTGEMEIYIACPPKYLIEKDYIEYINPGNWSLGAGWFSQGNQMRFNSPIDFDYGIAKYTTNSPTGSYIDIDLNEELGVGETLVIRQNGSTVYTRYSGFGGDTLRLLTNPRTDIEFEIIKPEPIEPIFDVVYVGNLDFQKTVISDGRGRVVRVYPGIGSTYGDSFETSEGFELEVDLKAGEEFNLRLPNRLIPYVDEVSIDRELADVFDSRELSEPTTVFYDDLNSPNVETGVTIIQDGIIITDNGSVIHSLGGKIYFDPMYWELESVFRFLEISQDVSDGIIGTKEQWPGMNFYIELDEPLAEDGVHTLSFEYGARFNGGRVRVAVGESAENTVAVLTDPSDRASGVHVTDVLLPAGTSKIWFLYYYE